MSSSASVISAVKAGDYEAYTEGVSTGVGLKESGQAFG